ncbi:hypothetical protein AVEN_93936-1 [Araneus ventricosus]|uniref:Uncharacterized protein n=1 Tax=Araneus ventricosus TaxID=182803 RepID=A0A4Y2R4Z3_ARAVE|nr:hypothetical protein AVEN_93936-1 [Araneus ventricosus]
MQQVPYTVDLQWNRASNLEPSGPNAKTLPLGHRGFLNKAQGQSLRVAGIKKLHVSRMANFMFHSRMGTPRNLYIYASNGETKNVVYPKALE